MNFLKAYNERVEEIPKYIDDYAYYLLDEFAKEFVKKALEDHFNNKGKKDKNLSYPVSVVEEFFRNKGYGKLNEVIPTILNDIRVLGFDIENGQISADPKVLINGYYDYLMTGQDIPRKLDDYAFYLFDELVKDFIPKLIKTYEAENKAEISYPIIKIEKYLQLKGYKKLESAMPIICKDLRSLGFDIKDGYIYGNIETLKKAYNAYLMVDEVKLSEVKLHKTKEEKASELLVSAPTIEPQVQIPEPIVTDLPRENNSLLEARVVKIPKPISGPTAIVAPTETYQNSFDSPFDLDIQDDIAPAEELVINSKVVEPSFEEKQSDYTYAIFESEVLYKMLPQMVRANSEKLIINYVLNNDYVIFNNIKFVGVNINEFSTYLAGLPGVAIGKKDNVITFEYNVKELRDFYFGELQNIEGQTITR